ncbi:MAG: hypothetical protein H6822_10630 [Planctomycetaceae bacterium]|nr:hypothetical protein [Planctomycetales bacterium]MCB9922628.1 hypothetical protein [Planctomycetaceae bacterium]
MENVSQEATSKPDDKQAFKAAKIVKRVRAASSRKSWEIFRQATVERRPDAQIASEFGVTIGTVYKTTFRIKQRLLEECQKIR